MLTHGQEYTDHGADYFEERRCQRVLHNLALTSMAMACRSFSQTTQPENMRKINQLSDFL
ncbi:MAG: hypothetical protein U1D69_01045 [Polynucleobacter sp.]|nr:hypothetical protein [Polynucleobacter sp.]